MLNTIGVLRVKGSAKLLVISLKIWVTIEIAILCITLWFPNVNHSHIYMTDRKKVISSYHHDLCQRKISGIYRAIYPIFSGLRSGFCGFLLTQITVTYDIRLIHGTDYHHFSDKETLVVRSLPSGARQLANTSPPKISSQNAENFIT